MITSIPNSRSLLLAGAVTLGLGVTAFAQQAEYRAFGFPPDERLAQGEASDFTSRTAPLRV